MKIAFFTEGGYFGKVPRNNPNMRTDQAWICALDAVHIPIFNTPEISEKFDVGIVIIPKEKNREHLAINQVDLIQKIKAFENNKLNLDSIKYFNDRLTYEDKVVSLYSKPSKKYIQKTINK